MWFNKKEDKSTSNIAKMDKKVSERFVQDEVVKIDDGDVEVLMDNEEAISSKLSNAGPLKKYAELGKLLFAMVKDIRSGDYKEVPWFTIATIVMALLYVLNPIDIIPDFIPGIGYIDDLAVLSIGMGWIETDLHRYLDWRLKKGE